MKFSLETCNSSSKITQLSSSLKLILLAILGVCTKQWGNFVWSRVRLGLNRSVGVGITSYAGYRGWEEKLCDIVMMKIQFTQWSLSTSQAESSLQERSAKTGEHPRLCDKVGVGWRRYGKRQHRPGTMTTVICLRSRDWVHRHHRYFARTARAKVDINYRMTLINERRIFTERST